MSRGSEPAYPVIETKADRYAGMPVGIVTSSGGMTLREHFAGLAMQGIIANPGRNAGPDSKSTPSEVMAVTAMASVQYADALLAELAKGEM